jgi:hypothetical protein
MRQGGLKPKSHSSGVYWVRANANSGNGSSKNSANSEPLGFVEVMLLVITVPIILVALPFYFLHRHYSNKD